MSSSIAPETGRDLAGQVAATKVGVIGAGVMGTGIAQALAVAGAAVVVRDLDSAVLDRSAREVRGGRFGLESAVARGKITEEQAAQALERISLTTELADVAGVDLVVEAVPEKLALKIGLFRELDRLTAPHAVLASNSSGFPIAALAAATDRPAQVIGWHWASPAPVMRLAEIVRTPQTAQATVDLVCRLAAAAGKNPVVINDQATAWGYVANRVYAAAVREANQILAEGVATTEQVDTLLKDCFRWPAGPYEMSAGAGSGWSG